MATYYSNPQAYSFEGIRDKNALIQAIESTEKKFIMGLQWHPEFMPYHWSSHCIFQAFCKEAKKHSALK